MADVRPRDADNDSQDDESLNDDEGHHGVNQPQRVISDGEDNDGCDDHDDANDSNSNSSSFRQQQANDQDNETQEDGQEEAHLRPLEEANPDISSQREEQSTHDGSYNNVASSGLEPSQLRAPYYNQPGLPAPSQVLVNPTGPYQHPYPPPPQYNAYEHFVHPSNYFPPVAVPPPPPSPAVAMGQPPMPYHPVHNPTVPSPAGTYAYGVPNHNNNVNNAAMMAHAYHEQAARMRDHAAAYANAAFSLCLIANAAAELAASNYDTSNGTPETQQQQPKQQQQTTAGYQPSNNNNISPHAFATMALSPNPPPALFPPPSHATLPSLQQLTPPFMAVPPLGGWWDNYCNNPDPGAVSVAYCDPTGNSNIHHENYHTSNSRTFYPERGEAISEGDPYNPSRKTKYNTQKDDSNRSKFHDNNRPSSLESYNRYRRKRHQRGIIPAEDSSIPREIAHLQQQQQQQQPRGKIRRRLRSDGDSSTTSSGSSVMPHGTSNHGGGPANNSLSQRSSSSRGCNHHNKKKARSDESLLGKTAVAALFEWCSKRQITPNFVLEQPSPEEFDFLVYLDDISKNRDGTGNLMDQKRNDENNNENEKGKQEPKYPASDGLGVEWGRGRGRNKVAAKQEAARRALQALIPGVLFDEDTGILVELPPMSSSSALITRKALPATSNCLDELAPNLAKQLAIGRDSSAAEAAVSTNKAYHQQPKRTLDVYPGTSTTSDEEDENTYYTSRGASVCSVLLHAMIQIDTARIPESPSFTYQMGPTPSLNNQNIAQLRRKVSNGKPLPAVRATRGSFTCTARLKIRHVQAPETNDDSNDETSEILVPSGRGEIREADTNALAESDVNSQRPMSNDLESSPNNPPSYSETVLEAVGIGGTKRESRHIASANLLALLFPECKDMVEVKAKAEAMRERYAASKVLKQHGHHSSQRRRELPGDNDVNDKDITTPKIQKKAAIGASFFALAKPSDPPIPSEVENQIRQIVGSLRMSLCGETQTNEKQSLAVDFDSTNVTQNHQSENYESNDDLSAAVFRRFSRQKQLDCRVEQALQTFNDRDEEGRTLPEELTADDVGRLVLRRAEPEDLSRIKKLNFVSTVPKPDSKSAFDSPKFCPLIATNDSRKSSPVSFLLSRSSKNRSKESIIENPEFVSQLWASSSIVLLLCRAIAAYEDPPLGCAVLTLGFSIEKGRFLRLVQIASEHHLPRERFLECLQNFASCMKCDLETHGLVNNQAHSEIRLSQEDINAVIESHIDMDSYYNLINKTSVVNQSECHTDLVAVGSGGFNGTSSKLQSVQEESEVSDSSSNDKRLACKRASKPSKRSRFQ